MESLAGKTSEEVEVPKLAENRRNWKIYRMKIIEAAATDITDPLGVLAGWQPDDGSYDWECLDAILKWTFYTSVPISILHPIWKLDTAHEIFNYLAKHFHDSNPIVDPRATSANDAKRDAHENLHMELRESPVSNDAATERHADAKRDEEDLLTTKDLHTRGMECVDGGNVGREDPHMSPEASVMGTSAECADETTTVVLESAPPHETQKQPQDSLRVTPQRLPIEGEPSECEQEVVDGVVTAGRTNRTVDTAKPPEVADADIDRTATLGRDLATEACGIGKGDGTECGYQTRLQQTKLYCKANDQHGRNANENIPITHGLPLEGEWIGCASGEARDPKGSASAPNATPECVHHPSESRGTEDAEGVESEGCKGGMVERASVDEADRNPGRNVEPADTPEELTEFVAVLIESEGPDGGGIPRVRLRGMSWHACHANSSRSWTDRSRGQADESKGWADESRGSTDASSMSNGSETDKISNGKGAGTYLGVGDTKHIVHATDGVRSQTDVSTGHGEVPNIQTDAIKPVNKPENISIPPEKAKPPDLPVKTVKRTPDEPNGLGNQTDGSSVRTDIHSIGNERQTAENNAKNVRTRQTVEKTQDSPYTAEIEPSKHPRRWRRVSADDISVYLPGNMPVEALDRTFAFGQLESGETAIAPNVEGKRACNGDGERNSEGGTTSSGSIDSVRVNSALLAVKSQYMRRGRRTRKRDSPVSSGPTIHPADRPYGLVRR